MLHKTLYDAIEAVRETVEAFGEGYVYGEHYDDCYYSVNGKPACLVGHVLAKWGVLPGDVDSSMCDVKGNRSNLYAGRLLQTMEGRGELNVDYDARTFLSKVQGAQDRDKSWGGALRHGLEAVGF